MTDTEERPKVDWTGDGPAPCEATLRTKRRKKMMRAAIFPASIAGFVLLMFGALASGPVLRAVYGDSIEVQALVTTPEQPAEATLELPTASVTASAAAKSDSLESIERGPRFVDPAEKAAPDLNMLAEANPRWSKAQLVASTPEMRELKEAMDVLSELDLADASPSDQLSAFAGRPNASGGDPRTAAAFAALNLDSGDEADSELAPTATTTGNVNFRTEPSDKSKVLMVVPAKSEIHAERDCNWCAVTFDGKDGYIHKSFIDYK